MITELLDPTVEQVQSLIDSLNEIPMNTSILCLKQLNMEEEAHLSGTVMNLSAEKNRESEKKTLRPMYVLSVSDDCKSNIDVMDKVRASRITEVTGIPIPCNIRGYKVVIIREYDVITVIKNEA